MCWNRQTGELEVLVLSERVGSNPIICTNASLTGGKNKRPQRHKRTTILADGEMVNTGGFNSGGMATLCWFKSSSANQTPKCQENKIFG